MLGSAVGWAGVVRGHKGLQTALEAWRNTHNTFSLGVCNGCQLMALLGWLDPPNVKGEFVCVCVCVCACVPYASLSLA